MHERKHTLIAHPHDPRFLNLRSLQTESGRSHSGNYIIEGIRHVSRAIEHSSPLELLFLEPSILSNRFGRKLARRICGAGVPCVRLDSRLYRDLTLAAEPQGIGAVLRQRWTSLEQVKAGRNSLWLAIESIDLPGNLGTILRTAEAAGVAGVFLLGNDSDPWHPACVRASMGSLFSLKLVRCTTQEFTHWARNSGVAIVASSPGGMLQYNTFRCRWPAVLLVGSERQGLSGQLLEAADFSLRIPMNGGCDSINAAVATGVLLFAMAGQLRSA